MNERNGFVKFGGKSVTLAGTAVEPGQKAPDFDVLDNGLKPVGLAAYRGKVLVIASVPSLDTSVCSIETRRFNVEAASLGPDVQVLAVSMDLPFAQKRWCAAEGIERVQTLSDHRAASFGAAYGVLIKEARLLARAVFVVGRDGVVRYVQIVPDTRNEPDYAAALEAARAAVRA
jgi:thiol peroxidase